MKNFLMFFSLAVLLIVLLSQSALANNIAVSSVILTGQSTGTNPKYTLVKFNVTWDNSWRDPVNYDAAWIFVKYKGNDGVWHHATLSTTANDHTAPSGSTITPSSDSKGVFIYRNANGTGSNNFANVQLRWNYGTDGAGDNDLVAVKVFAIEMAYVPTAEFAAGDGTSSASQFTLTTINTSTATTAPSGSGSLGGQAGGYPTGATVPDNASFPNGYGTFYCMKYEISQGQYADFLNTLTNTQATNDFPNQNGNNRHTISVSGGLYSATRPDRACNYLGAATGTAYADWAALRPMTELEYEKGCRGNQVPVAGEYAWGDISIGPPTYLSGPEDGTETVGNFGANAHCNNTTLGTNNGADGGTGPLRCGIFAKNSTTRNLAGASYYGIMELTGNVIELTVGLTNNGKVFTGVHGDGSLDANGNENVTSWPSIALLKGGSWLSSAAAVTLQVSARGTESSSVLNTAGFRCVRTAP